MRMHELTTTQLEIKNIVKAMVFHSSEPYATSTQIAKYFGVDHKNILQKIRSFHSYDELISRLKIQPRKRTIRGKEYPYFELDADAFTFTCLSITGKKAEKFKWVFIDAFKKATLEAITAKVSAQTNLANENFFKLRQEGKKEHSSYTDVIKKFCKYAEEYRGGSYNGKCPYYKLFQSLVYKSIGIKISKSYKPSKDSLSPEALEQIENVEKFLANKVLGYIDFMMPYRDIYSLCKNDLKRFEDEVQESQY